MNKKFLDREKFISCIDEKDKLFRGEKNYFSVSWEECLTFDCWKSWKEKIRTLSSEEVGFFADRVQKLRSRILWIIRSYRKDRWNDCYTRKLVGINEKELENITEKEFYENKSKNGVRELTTREIGDMLDKEQLISEINRLKAEKEQLKNNQTLTATERQERLKQNQQRLEQLEGYNVDSGSKLTKPSNDDNKSISKSKIFTILGIITLLIIGGIIATKKHFKKKSKKSS